MRKSKAQPKLRWESDSHSVHISSDFLSIFFSLELRCALVDVVSALSGRRAILDIIRVLVEVTRRLL